MNAGIPLDAHATIRFPHFTILVCGFIQLEQTWYQKPSPSPFWRLYYNLDPGNEVTDGDHQYALGPDKLWIFPANLLMGCQGGATVRHLWIHFLIEPPFLFFIDKPIALAMDPPLRESINLLLKNYPVSDTQWQPLNRIYNLSARLLHECFARMTLQQRAPMPLKLQRLIQWINNNSTKELSNSFLAHQVQMSREGFIRWFKQHTGVTPGRYLRGVRLDQSCVLLISTDMSIEQIAEACGFPNRHYFSRVFAQTRGCGPAQFRKQNNTH